MTTALPEFEYVKTVLAIIVYDPLGKGNDVRDGESLVIPILQLRQDEE